MPPELHPDLAVRPSTIAGFGLHAKADLHAGETIVRLVEAPTAPDTFGPINHSCDPNLVWSDDRTLVAVRDVAADEELTVDYSTAIGDPKFTLFCHCETYRCRQAVEGSDWRIPQLQARYAGRWHPAVQRLIDDDH